MKRVRVSKPSATTRTVDVADDASVAQCISAAGYAVENNEVVQVNGTATSLDSRPGDNDVIVIAAGAKGNAV